LYNCLIVEVEWVKSQLTSLIRSKGNHWGTNCCRVHQLSRTWGQVVQVATIMELGLIHS